MIINRFGFSRVSLLLAIVVLLRLAGTAFSQTTLLPDATWQDSSNQAQFSLRLKANLEGHEHQITFVDFSPDNRFLVTGGVREDTSRFWNTVTAKLANAFGVGAMEYVQRRAKPQAIERPRNEEQR